MSAQFGSNQMLLGQLDHPLHGVGTQKFSSALDRWSNSRENEQNFKFGGNLTSFKGRSPICTIDECFEEDFRLERSD